jgi:hypothetical protein
MCNGKVLRTDGKRIAEDNEVLPVQDAALGLGEILETKKARSLIDGFLINRRGSALYPAGIMVDPHRKAVAAKLLYPHTSEGRISERKIGPGGLLLFEEVAALRRQRWSGRFPVKYSEYSFLQESVHVQFLISSAVSGVP